MRSIADAGDQAMLERVDVTIFDMTSIVRLIADRMLPEAALPDAAFATRRANGAEPLLPRQRLGKATLDQSPARRNIAIAGQKRKNRMQMIGQHDNRVDC